MSLSAPLNFSHSWTFFKWWQSDEEFWILSRMKILSKIYYYWAESKNASLLVTLTESSMGVFSCSEVTLCRIRARCRAVSPSSSSTFRSAPLLTRSSTMEVWPWDTARRSGVCCRLFLISMLAWPYIKNEDFYRFIWIIL